ncbi:MAG: S41 family peptidase [Lachnospiraceae bacterium]|jgi:carboxyl-terminal processing protease|nr:S41 family peptidase [Lachnospiraceae bacterium]MCI8996169.1 S41 family peptidase [Lachnospiraceae bacterium]MCI9134603.1 S41 family peptidase [Lachnospiraceae bacterium]
MEGQKLFRKGILCGIGATLGVALILFLVFQIAQMPEEGLFAGLGKKKEGQLDVTNRQVQEKLEEIEGLINDHYLNETDEELVERYLYTGLLYGLGDPYAAYYTAEEYASLLDGSSGSYCGIGAMFSQNMNTGIITVVKVYEGCPAMEAGLLPGDILYAVEGQEATGQDLTKLVSEIKGEEGTSVRLTMVREGETDYLDFDVKRQRVEVPTVAWEMLEDQIGYIAVSEFDIVTSEQFSSALEELEADGMKGLIIDLRDNGGGVVRAVTEMADRMLPEGLIVYTEDKYGNRSEARSDAEHFFDLPLAVLVNGNSASASEIFAGAIKDYQVGSIVGTRTYGKGIVQQPFQLEDGTAIKLTISKYYTPKGNDIHGKGIEPDVEVELDEALRGKAVITHEEDNQLQTAMDVVREKIK